VVKILRKISKIFKRLVCVVRGHQPTKATIIYLTHPITLEGNATINGNKPETIFKYLTPEDKVIEQVYCMRCGKKLKGD